MKLKKIVLLLAVAGIASPAFATDGYFSDGYGMTAKGMGGAATAMATDSLGGANNPASMVWVGDRFDVGLDLFSPRRSIERSGSAITPHTGCLASQAKATQLWPKSHSPPAGPGVGA